MVAIPLVRCAIEGIFSAFDMHFDLEFGRDRRRAPVSFGENPEADRAFFAMLQTFPNRDVGEGCLIFALAAAAMRNHPAEMNFTDSHAGQNRWPKGATGQGIPEA